MALVWIIVLPSCCRSNLLELSVYIAVVAQQRMRLFAPPQVIQSDIAYSGDQLTDRELNLTRFLRASIRIDPRVRHIIQEQQKSGPYS